MPPRSIVRLLVTYELTSAYSGASVGDLDTAPIEATENTSNYLIYNTLLYTA